MVSTHAILFFGTPHPGLSEVTTLNETINRLAWVHMETTDVVLKDLRAHPFELQDIQSLYVVGSHKFISVFFLKEYVAPGVMNQRREMVGLSSYTVLTHFSSDLRSLATAMREPLTSTRFTGIWSGSPRKRTTAIEQLSSILKSILTVRPRPYAISGPGRMVGGVRLTLVSAHD